MFSYASHSRLKIEEIEICLDQIGSRKLETIRKFLSFLKQAIQAMITRIISLYFMDWDVFRELFKQCTNSSYSIDRIHLQKFYVF